jgi:hypothetical protein
MANEAGVGSNLSIATGNISLYPSRSRIRRKNIDSYTFTQNHVPYVTV